MKLFDKKPGLARPEDFRVWKEPELIYEGKLVEYRDFLAAHYPKKPNSDKYVEKRGINFDKFMYVENKEVLNDSHASQEAIAATMETAVDA